MSVYSRKTAREGRPPRYPPWCREGFQSPDDVPVDKVKDFQAKMEEFLTTRKEAVMAKIREQQALSDEIGDELKSAIEDVKSTYNA